MRKGERREYQEGGGRGGRDRRLGRVISSGGGEEGGRGIMY